MKLKKLIRLKDAPQYLGINRHHFNTHVRPDIPYIRMGRKCIVFDTSDLDAWVAEQKKMPDENPRLEKPCFRRQSHLSKNITPHKKSRTLRKLSAINNFEKTIALVTTKK